MGRAWFKYKGPTVCNTELGTQGQPQANWTWSAFMCCTSVFRVGRNRFCVGPDSWCGGTSLKKWCLGHTCRLHRCCWGNQLQFDSQIIWSYGRIVWIIMAWCRRLFVLFFKSVCSEGEKDQRQESANTSWLLRNLGKTPWISRGAVIAEMWSQNPSDTCPLPSKKNK